MSPCTIFYSIFVCCRNSLGRNDNPNAIEFASAFKKLLICHPATTSMDHNVISNATGILTVSSKGSKKPLPAKPQAQNEAIELELELRYEVVMLNEIDGMDPYSQHVCAYIALCIEEEIAKKIKQYKIKCSSCAFVLSAAKDKINDGLLAMKGENSKQPSASTLKIVIFCNAVLKIYSTENYQGNNFNCIWRTICENVDIDDLYTDFAFIHSAEDNSTSIDHKTEFISEVIKLYMTMKSQKVGNKITQEERGELIRFKKKRDYLLAGQ